MKRGFVMLHMIGLVLYALLPGLLHAQQDGCIVKPPAVKIHFGKGPVDDVNASPLSYYRRVSGGCPTDGHYTFVSSTPGCFYGDWFTLSEDHTPGDENGNMMIVNAHPGGGIFFNRKISGLKQGTRFELALWLMNICRLDICCSHLSPNFYILLSTTSGKKIAGFAINTLGQTNSPVWKKFKGYFNMPSAHKELTLTMYDNTIGGCGNDFALDDISFSECIQPPVENKPKKILQHNTASKQVVKKASSDPVKKPAKPLTIAMAPGKKTLPSTTPLQKATFPVPLVLQTRANPVIKQLEIDAGEVTIRLYDNGEIDGDTVSIYHNNQLVVSKARLSQKPITFSFEVNPSIPFHELVMVAENLGSIPPNTSLMIVTAKDKRWQVFISSTEQKNAKLLINLKQEP